MRHSYRLVNKIREHRELIDSAEQFLTEDAEIILVSYGSVSRVMLSAVKKARGQGIKAGAIRLISLWPFQDALFQKDAKYLVAELNFEGQLVREVARAAAGREVHFYGKCGELPTADELSGALEDVRQGRPLRSLQWKSEAW
jgi:2-oxoglutarate ferredoxin oxidoreductase subunit alpha